MKRIGWNCIGGRGREREGGGRAQGWGDRGDDSLTTGKREQVWRGGREGVSVERDWWG